MKLKAVLLLLGFLSTTLNGQVQNSMFEQWDLWNGREKPAEWYCPNLCPSVDCGPCDKVEGSTNDFAVRIHNVMPCVSSDDQAKSRAAGFIEAYFIAESDKFNISFDLKIDSIEMPAAFLFTLRGKTGSEWLDSVLVWRSSELQTSRISLDIELMESYDSLHIQFKSEGYLKSNAAHDCDLGYLSAIIDNIETSNIVSTKEPKARELLVFPNPFNNEIHLAGNSATEWEIIDLNGRILLQGKGVDIEDLNFLSAGAYFLRILNDRESNLVKIIKEID